MDITFKVNKVEYNIKSCTHDFELIRIVTTTKKDDDGNDVPHVIKSSLGGFGNPFSALRHIPNKEGLMSDAKDFIEAKAIYDATDARLREIIEEYGLKK